MMQARRTPGNLRVEARVVQGVYHTLTTWTDKSAMLSLLVSGAHGRATKAYRSIGSGRTLGFTAQQAPTWEAALQRWRSEAREV